MLVLNDVVLENIMHKNKGYLRIVLYSLRYFKYIQHVSKNSIHRFFGARRRIRQSNKRITV